MEHAGTDLCKGVENGRQDHRMKDWKASVRTWEKNQRQKNKKSKDDEGLEGWLNA